jgi:DNA-directed RNA polymerase specialized sigma24 family protein
LPEERIPDPNVLAPSPEAAGHELVEILQQTVKTRPTAEREIFELHFPVGFEEAEIAVIRGMFKGGSRRSAAQDPAAAA